jgi:hypothetical protein
MNKITMKDNDQMKTVSNDDLKSVRDAVMQAARDHLQAKDAPTAINHYSQAATIISNGRMFRSFAEFCQDTHSFYRSLDRVELAEWDQMDVRVLNISTAIFTGVVRWSSLDTSGNRLKLKGIWSAIYVLEDEGWKIIYRHESFENSGQSKF